MNNEAKLMEAMWAFLFWQSARPTDYVKITAGADGYEVILFIDEDMEVAKRLESEMKEKCRFLFGTQVIELEGHKSPVIYLKWEKED